MLREPNDKVAKVALAMVVNGKTDFLERLAVAEASRVQTFHCDHLKGGLQTLAAYRPALLMRA